jgi:hypothetical protein
MPDEAPVISAVSFMVLNIFNCCYSKFTRRENTSQAINDIKKRFPGYFNAGMPESFTGTEDELPPDRAAIYKNSCGSKTENHDPAATPTNPVMSVANFTTRSGFPPPAVAKYHTRDSRCKKIILTTEPLCFCTLH